MIKIIIHSGVHLFNLQEELKEKIRKDLTFNNPQYVNAKRYGKFANPNMKPYLYFFSEIKSKDVIYIPKGYFYFLFKHIKNLKLKYTLEDKTTVFPKLDFTFYGTPREYQDEAIKDIKRYPIGVLESGTGSGKTYMGIKMIYERQQPCLIIVHSKELLIQWTNAIKELLHYDVGQVGDGKSEIKDITVGIVKSVKNKIDQLKDRFGFVIVDETHRCPASTFTHVLSKISSRYQLGLSATMMRSDGLGYAIYAYIGPKIHKVSRETLHKVGAVLIPEIIRIETGFQYYYDGIYGKMLSTIAINTKRNNLICKYVYEDIKKYKSSILVVSDRVNHLELLKEILDYNKVPCFLLTSNTPKEERDFIIESMNNNDGIVLLSTTQLIGEGFDCPGLNALFLPSPIKYKGRLIQVIGRILRPYKGSNPRIYDFRDNDVKPLKNAAKERDKCYRMEWKK